MTPAISSDSASDRVVRGWLLAVLALALLLRLGWVLRLPASDQALAPLPDQLEYLQLARSLLDGRGLVMFSDAFNDELHAYRMPGYPAFIAALGGDVRAVRVVQALLDTMTVLAACLLARRWLTASWSVLAAALVAFNPFLTFFCGLILTETLFTAMLAWGMVFIIAQRRSRSWWLGAVLLALSVLVRPSALLLPILLAVGAAVANRGAGAPYIWKWAPPVATTVLVLQLAVLLPWGYRNHRVLGSWVFTTTNSGITMYDGFNPDATGASDQSFVRSMPQLRTMGERGRSQYLSERAWQYAHGRPKRVIELTVRKVARTWSPVPLSAEYGGRRNVIVAAGYMIPFLLLVVAGLGWGRLTKSAKVFLLLPAIYFTVAHAASVGSLRYRVPADVPMAVLAAAGAAAAVASAARKEAPG